MNVNGCQIVSVLCADSEDGFSSMVIRSIVTGTTEDETGNNIDVVRNVERGPFLSIKEAVHYSMSWTDINNPPPMPGGLRAPGARVNRADIPLLTSVESNVTVSPEVETTC